MNKYEIPFDLKQAMKTNILVSGGNSCGKTLLACGISSILQTFDFQVLAFDNSGIWKKKSDIPYIITVNPEDEGFPPIILDSSVIYDISLLRATEQKLLINMVLEGLWNWQIKNQNDKWRYIVLEEFEVYGRSIRGQLAESILRTMAVCRNCHQRVLAITPDWSLIDPAFIRLSGQRYMGKLYPEQNSRRKCRATLGKDWCMVMEALQTGDFVYYNNDKLKVVSVPIFNRTKKPQPLTITKPTLREQLKQLLK